MQNINPYIKDSVQTELKLYMTDKLHKMGLLDDEVCNNAKEIIMKEAVMKRTQATANEHLVSLAPAD